MEQLPIPNHSLFYAVSRESTMLVLCVVVDDKGVASSYLVEETKPGNVFRLVNENYHRNTFMGLFDLLTAQ